MKKGFTLIELLAVILILGIIALIAIPTIGNIIEEVKEGATKRSAENYIKAVDEFVALENIHGNVVGSFEVGDYVLNIKGTQPTSGNIVILNNEVVDYTLYYDDYTVTKDGITKTTPVMLTKSIFESNNTSWSDIIKSVQAGMYDNTSSSDLIGATKNIKINEHINNCLTFTGSGATFTCVEGTVPSAEYAARVVNVTPCTDSLESKTACGFVLEFVDVVDVHHYNTPTASETNGSNVGGFPSSELNDYLNGYFINYLPYVIRNNILDTTVVSSYGNSSSSNFVTTEKLYLLATHEMIGADSSSAIVLYDKSFNATRQLDYYAKLNVTENTNLNELVKIRYFANGTSMFYHYWFRSACSTSGFLFFANDNSGQPGYGRSSNIAGMAPAFRLN